jgi:lysyl-tRNA synthetase class I
MRARICNECKRLKWNKYQGPWEAITYRCTKGHKPRMYKHPDPHILFEIKRRCDDFKQAKVYAEDDPYGGIK